MSGTSGMNLEKTVLAAGGAMGGVYALGGYLGSAVLGAGVGTIAIAALYNVLTKYYK